MTKTVIIDWLDDYINFDGHKNVYLSASMRDFYDKQKLNHNWYATGKLIILGDLSVGKTSLLKSFCGEKISQINHTILVDWKLIECIIFDSPFYFRIFDTPAHKYAQQLVEPFLDQTDAALLLFDFTRISSISSLQIYKNLILSHKFCNQECYLFIIGTKKDAIPEYVFDYINKEIKLIAAKFHAEYWPTSAYDSECVDALFRRIISIVFCVAIKRKLVKFRADQELKELIAREKEAKKMKRKRRRKRRKTFLWRKIKNLRKLFNKN